MLVNCPKCGFSQPQDKYCAQCGVDMESFQVPKTSSTRQLFTNPIFQIGFVLVIAMIVATNLYRKDKSTLQDHFSSFKAKVQVSHNLSSTTATPSADTKASDPAASTANENLKPQSNVATSNAVPVAGQANSASQQNPTADGKEATGRGLAKPTGHMLHVFYTEMNLQGRNMMFEESRNSGQFNTFGDHTAGIIFNANKRLSGNNRDLTIHHREDKKIEIGKPLQWFMGIKVPEMDTEIGLTAFIELTDADNNNVRGNIEFIRSWKESNEPGAAGIQKRSYPAIFELAKDAAFFISGIIPNRSYLENEADLTNIGPFKILNSNKFVRNQTDSVIFVEIDRN